MRKTRARLLFFVFHPKAQAWRPLALTFFLDLCTDLWPIRICLNVIKRHKISSLNRGTNGWNYKKSPPHLERVFLGQRQQTRSAVACSGILIFFSRRKISILLGVMRVNDEQERWAQPANNPNCTSDTSHTHGRHLDLPRTRMAHIHLQRIFARILLFLCFIRFGFLVIRMFAHV